MAIVEGDTFQIPIEGDDKTKIAFAAIEKAVVRITRQFQKAQKSIEASFVNIGKSSEGINKVNESFKQTEKTQQTLVETTKNVGDNFAAFNAIVDVVESSLVGITAVSTGLAIAMERGLVRSFKDLSNVLQFATKDVVSIFRSINNQLTPGFINLVKGATLASPALILFGKAVQNSDSDLVRFSGTLSIIGGVLLGAFSLAVIGAIKILSDLAIHVGDNLIAAFTAFEKEAAKSTRIIEQFTFAIIGFNRVLGEEAVGSLDLWNKALDETEKSTTFTTEAIAKSIKLLIAEGSRLGLTVEDNTQLLERATDVAAATGKDLTNVTQALISALAGQGQAALAMGIDVRESALAHSKLLEASGKSFKNLNDGQKTILRLGEIFEQTRPIIGAAANDLQSVAGANEVLEKRFAQVRIELGKQTQFTLIYINSLQRLTEMFINLPDPVLKTVGALGDFLGVSLKIIGTIGKYVLTVAALVTGYQVLNSIIASSIAIQGGLNSAFAFSNARIGAQIVAVTGLGSVWTNIISIMRAGLIVALKATAVAIGSASLAFGKMLITLAPLALKLAILATFLRGVFNAVKTIVPQLNLFKIAAEALSGAFEFVSEKTAEFFDILSSDGLTIVARFVVVINNLARILVSGLAGAITGASLAWLKFKQAVLDSDEEAKSTQKTINALVNDMKTLSKTILKSGSEIIGVFTGEAFGAIAEESENIKNGLANISQRFDDMGNHGVAAAEDIAAALKQLVAENSALALSIGNMDASEVQRVQNNLQAALNNLRIKEQELKSQDLLTEAIKAQITEQARLLKTQAGSRIAKIQEDAAKKQLLALDALRAKSKSFEVDRLKGNNQLVAAQKVQNQIALAAFDKQNEKLRESLKGRQDELAVINETRDALIAKGEAELISAAIEQKKKALEIELTGFELLVQVLESAGQVYADIFEGAGNLIGKGFTKIFPNLSKSISSGFNAGIKFLQDAFNTGFKAISDFFGDESENKKGTIVTAVTEGGVATGAGAGAVDAILIADKIADAIQALIDFGPSFIDKVGKIFDSLVDLPIKLVESLFKLDSAINNFIDNFVTNLVSRLPQIITGLIKSLIKGFTVPIYKLSSQSKVIAIRQLSSSIALCCSSGI